MRTSTLDLRPHFLLGTVGALTSPDFLGAIWGHAMASGASVEVELGTVMDRLRRAHDILPFLDRLLDAREIAFAPVPAEMLNVLTGSPDYTPILPGGEPTWIQVSSADDRSAELILYRSSVDGGIYVAAPKKSR